MDFFKTKQSPAWESFKEFLRVAVMGVVAYLLTETATWLEAQDQATWVVLLTTALRGVDSWLHKTGRLQRGLTRF